MAILALEITSAPKTAASLDRRLIQTAAADQQASIDQLSATEARNQRTKQHNLAILEANQNASLSVPGQPLSLLYQTAIDAINAELAPTLGEGAVERAQEEGLDTSPEATAERILSASISSFGRFQELHPELAEPEQADRFIELISSGIEQGFAAAKDILDGLSVLEGSLADNIAKTYELVQDGLEQFHQLFLDANIADKAVREA